VVAFVRAGAERPAFDPHPGLTCRFARLAPLSCACGRGGASSQPGARSSHLRPPQYCLRTPRERDRALSSASSASKISKYPPDAFISHYHPTAVGVCAPRRWLTTAAHAGIAAIIVLPHARPSRYAWRYGRRHITFLALCYIPGDIRVPPGVVGGEGALRSYAYSLGRARVPRCTPWLLARCSRAAAALQRSSEDRGSTVTFGDLSSRSSSSCSSQRRRGSPRDYRFPCRLRVRVRHASQQTRRSCSVLSRTVFECPNLGRVIMRPSPIANNVVVARRIRGRERNGAPADGFPRASNLWFASKPPTPRSCPSSSSRTD